MKAKYFIAIVFLIITGCKKETTNLSSDVQGTWELVSMTNNDGIIENVIDNDKEN